MSVATHIDGLKYYAPIAISRLYDQRALFSYTLFQQSMQTFTPRPTIHIPDQKLRQRSKTEKSPMKKSKHGLVSRHGCDA